MEDPHLPSELVEPALATGAGVARNTALTLAGLAVPLMVAVLLVPILTHNLGPARFGLLGISWATLDYLVLFDVGITRATTQFVASALGNRSRDLPQVVSVSVATILLHGFVGGLLAIGVAPLLAERVFRTPPSMIGEATALFRVVGLSVPVVLLVSSLRGVLEGAQRFDLSTAVKIPSSIAAAAIPAAGAVAGMSLPSIMLLVLVARVATVGALWVLVSRAIPGFTWQWPREWHLLRSLLSFGAWVATSSIVSPLLVYLDRLMLGGIVGMAAVGYYTAPYEGITRLLVVPFSLATALFPAVAGMHAAGRTERLGRIVGSAVRVVFLVVLPVVAIAFVFAPDILRVWLGPTYMASSATALRILSLGVLVNALAHPSYAFVQATNRPDLTAKFHLIELVIHVPLAWMLVHRFGIAGAAMAWTLRVSLDTTLLSIAAWRLRNTGVGVRSAEAWGAAGGALVFVSLLLLSARFAHTSAVATVAVVLVSLGIYSAIAWRSALDSGERAMFRGLLSRFA